MMTVFRVILLIGLVGCAIATAIVRKPMQAVIIYSAFSVVLAVIWITLEAPDLAVTEAAVGAGVTGILLYLTLRQPHRPGRGPQGENAGGGGRAWQILTAPSAAGCGVRWT